MNLYKIEQEYINLSQQLIENGGELTEELNEALQINQHEMQVKGVNYAYVIKQLEAEAEMCDAEIKRVQDMKKSRLNAAERLKTSIANAMQMFDISEIKGGTVKMNFRKSESIEVENTDLLPAEYKRTKISIEADKVKIKDAIKAGEVIPGALLVQKQSLQIK